MLSPFLRWPDGTRRPPDLRQAVRPCAEVSSGAVVRDAKLLGVVPPLSGVKLYNEHVEFFAMKLIRRSTPRPGARSSRKGRNTTAPTEMSQNRIHESDLTGESGGLDDALDRISEALAETAHEWGDCARSTTASAGGRMDACRFGPCSLMTTGTALCGAI